jgi:hypothetical protein
MLDMHDCIVDDIVYGLVGFGGSEQSAPFTSQQRRVAGSRWKQTRSYKPIGLDTEGVVVLFAYGEDSLPEDTSKKTQKNPQVVYLVLGYRLVSGLLTSRMQHLQRCLRAFLISHALCFWPGFSGQCCSEDAVMAAVEQYQTLYALKRKADNRPRQRRCRAQKRKQEMFRQENVDSISQNFGEPDLYKQGSTTGRNVHRVTTKLSKDLALHVVSELQPHNKEIQIMYIEKFLAQPLLKGILPSYLCTAKMKDQVVGNLREGIHSHLSGVQKTVVVMGKDIVCALSVGADASSKRGLASVLGVDRRSVRKGISHKVSLDTAHNAFWLHYRRARRSDAMSNVDKEVVRKWWEEETTVSPNRKDVVNHRVGIKEYESHPTQYLQVSQVLRNLPETLLSVEFFNLFLGLLLC